MTGRHGPGHGSPSSHGGFGPRHFIANELFGFGPPHRHFGGRGWGPGGGRRARRGDVRLAALMLLAEGPRNGYGIMQEIEQRSEGAWRPSPGSVYPALSQLEDEGLIRAEGEPGSGSATGRVYALTDAGRQALADQPADRPAPWDEAREPGGDGRGALFGVTKGLGVAALQVAQAGNDDQIERAQVIMDEARRALYRLLAEDETGRPEAESSA